MRKLLFFAFLATTGFASAQIVNIPDPAFKNKLVTVYGMAIDTNSDQEIQVSEAEAFTGSLNISGNSSNFGTITDLTGIEAFTNLTWLNCSYNQITSLDLSGNPNLTGVLASYNNISSITLPNSGTLNSLVCEMNQITSLNLESVPNLTILHCDNNDLTELNISANTALTDLFCANNELTELNMTSNTALTTLSCPYNALTQLNVDNNSNLLILNCIHNQIQGTLNVSNNTALNSFSCSYNQITALTMGTQDFLTSIGCNDNLITQLNIDNCSALLTLGCFNNQISELNISNNAQLNSLYCAGNQITQLDVSNNVALATLSCFNNPLTSLTVVNPNLQTILCGFTALETLDLSSAENLSDINCNSNNNLTYINLKNGNNNNLNYVDNAFVVMPNLEQVCLDDANSSLATNIEFQVGHNVTFTEDCPPVVSADTFTAERFMLYPNPTENSFSINSLNAIESVTVYNLLGQKQPAVVNNGVVNINNLSSGTYLVKITDNQGNSSMQRILKK